MGRKQEAVGRFVTDVVQLLIQQILLTLYVNANVYILFWYKASHERYVILCHNLETKLTVNSCTKPPLLSLSLTKPSRAATCIRVLLWFSCSFSYTWSSDGPAASVVVTARLDIASGGGCSTFAEMSSILIVQMSDYCPCYAI